MIRKFLLCFLFLSIIALTGGPICKAMAQSGDLAGNTYVKSPVTEQAAENGSNEAEASEPKHEDRKSCPPSWFPQILGAQYTAIYQEMPPFHSPYEGNKSLSFQDGLGHDVTQTYGLYFGAQLAKTLQLYFDAELFLGHGISNGQGLGGYTNGDVIRAGSADLGKGPYVARVFFRYYYPLGTETEKVERAMDQIPGEQPVSRFEVKAGKLTVTDDFDLNRYANNGRTQFMNYDFMYNTSYDYAADTQGYTYGVVAALFQPRWRLALGVYMEPNTANGATFHLLDFNQLAYNLEFTWKPNDSGTVIRFLSFLNEGRMGNYNSALAVAAIDGSVPDLVAVTKGGNLKYGFGINFEQPLADNGDTGIFARLGWNDGNTQTWSYTEVDRNLSLGAQVSGVHWWRENDRLGIAYGLNALSGSHKDYLAAGGEGILLGDGALNYGLEHVVEAYYMIQVCKYFQLTPDVQFIANPGYNRDRGPVGVYSLRMRMSW